MTTAVRALMMGEEGSTPAHKAIRAASRATGIGFDYLVTTANRESALNPLARAGTSSASGLFQFVDSTWLAVIKDHGADFGFAREAEAIHASADGHRVDDPAMREHIMNLRMDPNVNAVMAGAFTRNNSSYLSNLTGRPPSQGELYIAHFLGAKGAGEFITKTQKNPDAPAADFFPRQAVANKTIFYENGRKRSMNEVYAALVSHHQNAPLETQKIASALLSKPLISAPANRGPVFHNLFTPRREKGVSPVIAALWTRRDSPAATPVQIPASTKPFFPVSPAAYESEDNLTPLMSSGS